MTVISGEHLGVPPFIQTDLGDSWLKHPGNEIELEWTPNHAEAVELKDRIGDDIVAEDYFDALTRAGMLIEMPFIEDQQLSRVDYAFLSYNAVVAEKAAARERSAEKSQAHANLEAVGKEINRVALEKFQRYVNFKAMPTHEAWPLAESEATIDVVSYLVAEERQEF